MNRGSEIRDLKRSRDVIGEDLDGDLDESHERLDGDAGHPGVSSYVFFSLSLSAADIAPDL